MTGCGGRGSSGGDTLFEDWPDQIICDGTVWKIHREGVYNCIGGGESTTRSALLWYNASTRRVVGEANRTQGRCLSGSCWARSIDQLIDDGLAK